jgi:ABC-type glycerol-3-phosphate transport system substrate-binding protein
VFWVDPIDCSDYQHNHNALMPLDSYLKPLNIDLGDVYTGALECGKVDGRLYMAPRAIAEQLLIYNQSMMESAGIDFDNSTAYSWESFKDLCKRMTVIENGTVQQAGASLKIWWEPVWPMFFRGFGGEWINSIEHRVTITSSTEVMQGIDEIVTGVLEGWLFPEDIAGQIRAMNYGFGDGTDNMAHVCFKTFNGMSWLFTYGRMYDILQVDWDLCPFPAFPTHTVSTGATGYVVYNRTRNPDVAAAFALFFLTPEGQIAYQGQTGGNVPVLKSLAEDDFWKGVGTDWTDKNYAALVAYPEQTRPCNTVLFAPVEIADIFSNDNMTSAFVKIINGTADAQTVFGQLERKANEKWATLYS